jgi:pimeloyl-ACP methyl ester carboxylesterase
LVIGGPKSNTKQPIPAEISYPFHRRMLNTSAIMQSRWSRTIDKPYLILLPGQLCDEAVWRFQIAGLSDIATIWVADLTQDDSIAGMAERVLYGAPQQFALAGLSLGGYVAFEIMRRAPERVDRLALMNTSARSDEPEQTSRRDRNIKAVQIGTFHGVTARLLPSILHPDHARDPGLAGIVMSMTERVGRLAFVLQQTAIMNRPDSRAGLKAINCPTLVIGGQTDHVTPAMLQEEIAAGIAGARLEILEICGHLAPLEQPEKVNRLMREWVVQP